MKFYLREFPQTKFGLPAKMATSPALALDWMSFLRGRDDPDFHPQIHVDESGWEEATTRVYIDEFSKASWVSIGAVYCKRAIKSFQDAGHSNELRFVQIVDLRKARGHKAHAAQPSSVAWLNIKRPEDESFPFRYYEERLDQGAIELDSSDDIDGFIQALRRNASVSWYERYQSEGDR